MGRLRALLALLLAPALAEPVGCYHYGFAFTNPLANVSGNPFSKVSAYECQLQCRNTNGCAHFGYYPVSGSCYIGSSEGILYAADGAVAGPAECPELNKGCTELPGSSFPAETPLETMKAWPGGVQPTPLQCWPRRTDGQLMRCRNQTATVLEDTEDGWPGRCEGMVKITDLKDGETCQMRCMMSPLCSVWSIESTSDPYGASTCWNGMLGTNCYGDDENVLTPVRAQRLQHGTYRVLMQVAGVQILGLHNSFGGTVYSNWEDGAKHCKLECRSFLLCQFWQYSKTYGCFLEMPQKGMVGYPLTTTGTFRSVNLHSEAAADIVAGEMIQHNCIGLMSPIPTATPVAKEVSLVVPGFAGAKPPEVQEWPFWAYLLIWAAIVMCMAVAGAAIWMGLKEREKRRGGGFRGSPQVSQAKGAGYGPMNPAADQSAGFLQNIHMPQMPWEQQQGYSGVPGYGQGAAPGGYSHPSAHTQTRGG
eukprot:CAMPEP_0181411492 /NCGR_PEP_ID=MMETSP1110-20121109/7905_1 /TAXON_ID=174948 /ORGANISM="Symbiodinium sp., Strain CCMP421" /LENGTH=475 /DNA_ID=CAMNT_0023534117 /DNA_START=48 /DNA_END=1472 /DNA_ORIENTATION=+